MLITKKSTQLIKLNITSRLLAYAAMNLGYKLKYYPSSLDGESGIIECTKGSTQFSFKSTYTHLTPSYGYFTADNKVLTYNLLKANNVPTPKTFEVSKDNISPDIKLKLREYVVKPVSMNHGDGVSVGIKSKAELIKAINYALKVSNSQSAIVQEKVEGKEYRFLVLDGKVIAVAGREPASITGDGVNTVEQMIVIKNKDPDRGEGHASKLTKIKIEDVKKYKGQKFMDYIPNEGEKVILLDTTNLSKGGEATDYTDIAADSLKEIAINAARSCSLGLAGVDIITDNISNPSHKGSYVIELNVAPGLRMHHFPSSGKSRDVASIIITKLEEREKNKLQKIHNIAVSSYIDVIGYKQLKKIPARIDSGARTSSLWASDIKINGSSVKFKMFGPGSKYYTGKYVTMPFVERRVVTSSTGHEQERIVVKFPIRIKGKKILAKFTLSDRSTQTYPLLIGRNTLRGHFLVDCSDPGDAAIYKYPEEKSEFKEIESK